MKPYFQDDQAGLTIYHGDCFDVLPALGGIGAVITDPPYSSGGSFRGDRMASTVDKYTQSGTMAYRPEFAGDNRDQRSFAAWCTLWLNAARRACVPGAHVACFIDWRQLPTMTDALQGGGWIWRGVGVWFKKWGRVNNAGFSSACEFLPWGTNGPATMERSTFPAGVVECQSPRERDHVAQKPEQVMRLACSLAVPGTVILDPFMGSGTTLVAAKEIGCKCIGIECDERYCELAANRLRQGVLFGCNEGEA